MKILVHICCAPCFSYLHRRLCDQGHSVVGYWFNPNIHPFMEYKARMEAMKKYAALETVTVIYEEYELIPYLHRLLHDMDREGDRCLTCYYYRLEKTVSYAQKHGFDAFTTTLLSSHNQKHDGIREVGENLGKKFHVPFLYEDFREGWNQAKAITAHYGLYRQRYCGCLFSEWERYRG